MAFGYQVATLKAINSRYRPRARRKVVVHICTEYPPSAMKKRAILHVERIDQAGCLSLQTMYSVYTEYVLTTLCTYAELEPNCQPTRITGLGWQRLDFRACWLSQRQVSCKGGKDSLPVS